MTYLIFLLAFIGCGESQEVKKIELKNVNDTSHLTHLFSFITVESSSILVNKDTVTLFEPLIFKDQKTFALSQFYFDRIDQKFRFDNFTRKTNHLPTFDKKSGDKEMIFFDSIKSLIYLNSQSSNLLKKSGLEHLIKNESIITKFDEYLFIVEKEGSAVLSIFNELNKNEQKMDFGKRYYSIESVLVNDINNDGNPEMFIFHKGDIARPNAVSYDIYSITIK